MSKFKKILIKISVLFMSLFLLLNCSGKLTVYAYPIMHEPTSDISQARKFLEDRHASSKMINSLEYIYSYSKKVGVDPTLIVAMSSIETGYGKSNLFVHNNNPTGMKSRHGWAKYRTVKEGYKAMINHYALYAGCPQTKAGKHSWLNGVAKDTTQMKGIWWGSTGNEGNYHKYLSIQVESIKSYPVKKGLAKNENIIDAVDRRKKSNILIQAINNHNNSNGVHIIEEILNRDNKDSDGMSKIFNAIK